jgi:hypothetical protein
MLLLTTAMVLSLQAQNTGSDTLTIRLRALARTAELTAAGELAGAGGEFLRAGVHAARFTMVAEEHGVVEVPRLTQALWLEGRRAGYSHFAIEVGEQLAVRLETALRADKTDAAYLAYLKAHWPGAPFYTWREDAALLRAIVNSTPGQRGVLWGLDYDIIADRHALGRLRELAPDASARRVADSAIAVADSALDRAMREQNPGLIPMFGGDSALFSRLRAAYRPRSGSEADRILTLMDSTLMINRLFLSGQGYESNLRRSRLLKRQFWRHYDSTSKALGKEPRVMLKFGATHLQRGRNFVNSYDLGSLLPELAEKEGGEALSLYVVGGPRTKRAQIDPRTMTSTEIPVQSLAPSWAKPFVDASDPDKWTVFDLRALRAATGAGRYGTLAPALVQVIFGFDALVVLSKSMPQQDLPVSRRP